MNTMGDHVKAVDALSQDFLGEGLQSRIKELSGLGQTVVIHDEREAVVNTQIRPRQSNHDEGGSA